MTQRHSNSYAELEQVLCSYNPCQRLATRMIVNGPEHRAANGRDMAPDEIQAELDYLGRVADEFNVTVSTEYDEASNSALVMLNGYTQFLGDLVAHMAAAEHAGAR